MRVQQRQRERLIRGLIGIALISAVMELVARSGMVNGAYLPPLSNILSTAGALFVDPVFLEDLTATILAMGVGLVISTLVAVPAGILLGSNETAFRLTRSLVEFLRPIPTSAIIPVAILLFGQQLGMKVFLICFAAIWPILFNTIYGVHDVDPTMKDTARSFGYRRLRILTRVVLPAASPYIYGGIRIAGAISLIVAVSAEIITAAGKGIGTFIMRVSQTGGEYQVIYAAAIIAGLLGWLLNWVLVRGEIKLFRWNPNLAGGSR